LAAGTNRDVVDRYVAAMTSKNFDSGYELLSEEVIETYPQSGETFRGRANIRAIMEQYPGVDAMRPPSVDDVVGVQDRWVMTPLFTAVKVAGGGEAYTLTGRITYPNGDEWHLVQLLRVEGGRISHLTTYFAAPFEAADWRSPYRE